MMFPLCLEYAVRRDMARVRRAPAFDHESMRISLCEKRAPALTQAHKSPILIGNYRRYAMRPFLLPLLLLPS
ncbi:MAG: hypothetical protein RR860_15230, partial [Janthinobacterium sp.]